MEVVATHGDNQFWKTPDMYDLDDLMKDYEDGDNEPQKEEVKAE